MTIEDALAIIQLGMESRGVDFKRTYSWADSAHKEKITKTIIGMSNKRDGGQLILGVDETEDGQFTLIGMPDCDFDSLNYDDLSAHVSNYADPYVEFELFKFIENKIIVIVVKEFKEVPVICKKDGRELQKGVVYTRGWRIPETVPVPTQTEMREIIEMAVEKELRRFHERINKAGFRLETQASEEQKFNNELGGI